MFRLLVRPTINSHYYSGQSILFPVLLLFFIFCGIRIYIINQHIVIEQVSFIYINGKSIEQKNHNLFNIVQSKSVSTKYCDTLSYCLSVITILYRFADTISYCLSSITILYCIGCKLSQYDIVLPDKYWNT